MWTTWPVGVRAAGCACMTPPVEQQHRRSPARKRRSLMSLIVESLLVLDCRYGGGRVGLSDTYTGAFWVADALFAFANAGANGFHLHWGKGGDLNGDSQPNTGVQTNFEKVRMWCMWGPAAADSRQQMQLMYLQKSAVVTMADQPRHRLGAWHDSCSRDGSSCCPSWKAMRPAATPTRSPASPCFVLCSCSRVCSLRARPPSLGPVCMHPGMATSFGLL